MNATKKTDTTPKLEQLLTNVADFAFRHDVCANTVRSWIALGMPSKQIGRMRKVVLKDADAWVMNGGMNRKKKR